MLASSLSQVANKRLLERAVPSYHINYITKQLTWPSRIMTMLIPEDSHCTRQNAFAMQICAFVFVRKTVCPFH